MERFGIKVNKVGKFNKLVLDGFDPFGTSRNSSLSNYPVRKKRGTSSNPGVLATTWTSNLETTPVWQELLT